MATELYANIHSHVVWFTGENFMQVKEDLQRLRELTEGLPPMPPTIASDEQWKVHKMTCGTSISCNLDRYQPREIAGNALWFNSAGTKFPLHTHEGREWLIVTQGSMLLTEGDSAPIRLLPGDYAVLEPQTEHKAEFLEDCWYYAITIPRDPNWPG